ncbi:MAG: hypothetical protein Kow001_13740 [Acidobacteriota bacterium]
MGSPVPLSAEADGAGDPRPLRYEWTIIQSATGKERLTDPDQKFTRLEIWEAEPGSSQGVGQTIKVQLVVSFAEPTSEDSASDPWVLSIPITARNRPPVPRILDLGGFGTPTDRIPAGSAIHLFDDSTDPDGDSGGPNWSFGAKRGGAFQGYLVMFGSHGSPASFTVPNMSSPIDQDVKLTVKEGLYMVSTTVTTYLKPAPTPPPSAAIPITLQPTEQTVQRGATATFKALASSSDVQSMSFIWTFEGSTVEAAAPVRKSDTEWESTLSIPTAQYPPKDYRVGVRAYKDVSGSRIYSNTLAGLLSVREQASNQPPTARIRHDHNGDGVFDAAGTAAITTLRRSVALHGHSSTDDGGADQLTFNWSISGAETAQLKFSNGPETVLEVPEGFEGSVKVTLTVQDREGLTSSASATFSFQVPNDPPVAVMRYTENEEDWHSAAPGSTVEVQTRTVLLDAGESTDDGGVDQLTFTWSATVSSYLSATRGARVSLNVPATGSVKVTLTAQDAKGAKHSVSATFKFVDPNSPPVAAIRYAEGEGGELKGPVAPETTVEVGTGVIRLDASSSTDDSGTDNLTYTWSAGLYAGYLSATKGAEVKLTVPEGFTSTIKVTLTVRDAAGAAGSVWVNFKFVAGAAAPVAAIKFDDDGDGLYTGPFDSGHVTQAASRTVALSGEPSTDDGPAAELTFAWSVSGVEGAQLSAPTSRETQLTVPAGSQGTATVVLTVTDGTGKSSSATLNLVFSASSGTRLSAQILAPPTEVEVGQELLVEGAVEGDLDPLLAVYEWRAFDGSGDPVEVFSRGTRARLVVPDLDGDGSSLRLEFRVRQGETASEWASVEVPVVGPRLYFSQLGVGLIPGTTLQFETSVVLVNGSGRTAIVRAVLANNQAGPNWRARIDGELRSELFFEIPAGGARKFLISDSQVGFGWMMVSANVKLAGYLFYRVVDTRTGQVEREVPILPVTGRSFRTAVDPGRNHDLALALVNPTEETVRFRVIVTPHTGTPMESFEMELAPGEHMAKFLGEILDGVQHSAVTIPAEFPGGTLQIVGDSGRLVATIIRTSGGLPQSILPVVTEE